MINYNCPLRTASYDFLLWLATPLLLYHRWRFFVLTPSTDYSVLPSIAGGLIFSITYLPLGDHDYFDWQSDEINIKELTEIVNKKEACGELVGLELLWDTTDIGGHLLIHSELNFSFSIIINRKELNSLNNDRVTDINWYVERIIVLLKNSDYIVESFSFNEYW